MPSVPENGARIVLRSMVARISRILASACLCAGCRRVELGARDRVLLDQALHPFEHQPRQLQLRFRSRELCLLLLRVQLDEDVAAIHRPPRVERDPFDDAGEVGADGHALNGLDRADRVEAGGPVLALRHDGRDCFRGRLHRGELRRHRLELFDFDERQRPDERGHQHQHEDHSLRHLFPSPHANSQPPAPNPGSRLRALTV